MILVDVHEAKSGLSRLIAQVEQVVIPRGGKAAVGLVPQRASEVRFGTADGRIVLAEGAFDWPDADIADQFSDS